jgi:CTP:molybdopterin cytidylyltransferase MocA
VTVAAVILAASPESALADAAGRPSARRIVETAWAGGAVPIVVVAADPDGAVAGSLAGSGATLAEPAPLDRGPVAQMVRGVDVATAAVGETDAALLWPARMTWVDPETVTTLIEAHGARGGPCLRPAWEGAPGWPVLLPAAHLDALARLAADRMPDELMADLGASGVLIEALEVGDPGVVLDRETPLADLPAYDGPPAPIGPAPEWGAAAADLPDDAPLEGPTLAPWPPASS